jgi:hypothetical protein
VLEAGGAAALEAHAPAPLQWARARELAGPGTVGLPIGYRPPPPGARGAAPPARLAAAGADSAGAGATAFAGTPLLGGGGGTADEARAQAEL